MKNIHTLDRAINMETQMYEAKIARIKRFYKFWNTMLVDDGKFPRFKVKGKIYWATSIDLLNYRLFLTPEVRGDVIEMNFND